MCRSIGVSFYCIIAPWLLRGGLHEILAEAFGIESVVWCKAPCRFISANTLFSTVEKRKLFENLDDPNSNVFNVSPTV